MKNHVILTLGRSGSNSLVDLINQHPNLVNYGEVLGDWIPMRRWQKRFGLFRNDNAAWLDFLVRSGWAFYGAQTLRGIHQLRSGSLPKLRARKTVANLGIKEFSLNLRRFGLEDYLRDRPDIQVVCLRRLSVLDRTISYLMLEETGVVARHESSAAKHVEAVTLEPNRFVTALAAVQEENADLERMISLLPGNRVHQLTYESLFESSNLQQILINELYQFLGAGSFKPEIRTRKVLLRTPSETIANFSDCRDAALRAGYGGLFP